MKMRYATPLEAWIHAGGDPLVRNWNTLTAKGSFWQGSLWQAFRLAFGAQLCISWPIPRPCSRLSQTDQGRGRCRGPDVV